MESLVKLIKISLYIFGVLFILFLAVERFENPRSKFDNFEQLSASGLIDKGWLPSYFPRSATNILEQHNIDTNKVLATFSYHISDIDELLNHCSLVAKSEQSTKLVCSSRFEHTHIFVLNKNGSGKYYNVYNGI